MVIWTVTNAELGRLRWNENAQEKGYGGRQAAEMGALILPIPEALGPLGRSRGYMNGADLTIHK